MFIWLIPLCLGSFGFSLWTLWYYHGIDSLFLNAVHIIIITINPLMAIYAQSIQLPYNQVKCTHKHFIFSISSFDDHFTIHKYIKPKTKTMMKGKVWFDFGVRWWNILVLMGLSPIITTVYSYTVPYINIVHQTYMRYQYYWIWLLQLLISVAHSIPIICILCT